MEQTDFNSGNSKLLKFKINLKTYTFYKNILYYYINLHKESKLKTALFKRRILTHLSFEDLIRLSSGLEDLMIFEL